MNFVYESDPKENSNQQAVLTEVMDIIQDAMKRLPSIKTYLVLIALAFLVLLALLHVQTLDQSLFYVVSLHVLQVVSVLFLTGFIFHVVLISWDEHQAYRNVELEVKSQMRQLKRNNRPFA